MKRLTLLLIFLLFVGSVNALTLPSKDAVVFLDEGGTTLPDKNSVVFLDGLIPTVAAVSLTITDACGTTTIFHNSELNCTFNATYDGAAAVVNWTINDSRVDIISLNLAGQVYDNPTLSDYNLPGCWSVDVTASGGDASDTATFSYCVNDTAPAMNETFVSISLVGSEKFSIIANFTDFEADPGNISINCTAFNITVDNSTNTYNLSREGDSAVEQSQVCLITLSDDTLSSTQEILLNLTNSSVITIPANISGFIPSFNVSQATINASLNTYTEYNITMENMTGNNPLWNITNLVSSTLNIQAKLNETVSDVVLSCGCTFNPTNTTNLTTSFQTLCTIPALGVEEVWCWTNMVAFNFTTRRNISLDTSIQVVS